jgi:prolyl-tRNA editing enzyme YbaK/EbsC (Cys-tRNA(Pro) deacylase)
MIELRERKIKGKVKILSESARSASEAAAALGIEKGQIASSIVFKLPDGRPLLVITSGAHRVDTDLVARELGVEKLNRADADFIKSASGISIGGVATMSNNELAAQGGRRTSHPNSRLMKSPPSIC